MGFGGTYSESSRTTKQFCNSSLDRKRWREWAYWRKNIFESWIRWNLNVFTISGFYLYYCLVGMTQVETPSGFGTLTLGGRPDSPGGYVWAQWVGGSSMAAGLVGVVCGIIRSSGRSWDEELLFLLLSTSRRAVQFRDLRCRGLWESPWIKARPSCLSPSRLSFWVYD